MFFSQGKVPEYGWPDLRIEWLLQELAAMDSNNFPGILGGETSGQANIGLECMSLSGQWGSYDPYLANG